MSCEIKAVSPTSDEAYARAAGMWAKTTAPETLKLRHGTLFSWQEKVHITLGESDWYSNINALNINTRRAIGIIGHWRDFDLVAAISALPPVASALSASLPKVLKTLTGKEITTKDIRVKLGSFLYERYEAVKDQLHYLEWLRPSGERISIQKKYDGEPLRRPESSMLNVEQEREPITAEDLLQQQGIVAVGISREGSWYILNRTLSVQLSDVTASLNDIGFRTVEMMELLGDYIEEVK
jgi:hypothetical protein